MFYLVRMNTWHSNYRRTTRGRFRCFTTSPPQPRCTWQRRRAPQLKLQGLMFPRLNTSNGLSGVSAALRERAENPLSTCLVSLAPFAALYGAAVRFLRRALLTNASRFDGQKLSFGAFCVVFATQVIVRLSERRESQGKRGPCSCSQEEMLNGAFDAVILL